MIGETENPLTEVALALSMAFFSLMVLMLFAITNTTIGTSQQTASVQSAPSQPSDNSHSTYLIFFNEQYFNETLEPTDPKKQDTGKPLFLAVMPDLDVSSMMRAMQKVTHPSPEVITLSQDWIQALKSKQGTSK